MYFVSNVPLEPDSSALAAAPSQVLELRAGHLSNLEVLSLLGELESSQIAEARAAHEAKVGPDGLPFRKEDGEWMRGVSENLRTIEFEAIKYLSNPLLPTTRQSPEAVRTLLERLDPYTTLTRAERLQIVNLAPTTAIELYVIVEELEDRLSEEEIETILGAVAETVGAGEGAGAEAGAEAGMPSAEEPLFMDGGEEEEVEEQYEDEEEDLIDGDGRDGDEDPYQGMDED